MPILHTGKFRRFLPFTVCTYMQFSPPSTTFTQFPLNAFLFLFSKTFSPLSEPGFFLLSRSLFSRSIYAIQCSCFAYFLLCHPYFYFEICILVCSISSVHFNGTACRYMYSHHVIPTCPRKRTVWAISFSG
jgi:hypothetical protein